MRRLLLVCVVAGCGSDSSAPPLTFDFGPFDLAPAQEITDDCVQVTLDNEDAIELNAVELTSGTGFHHSNWFWTRISYLAGVDDGVFSCHEAGFNEATAAAYGGVIFAQSTQDTHELQEFPEGVAVRIPPHSK